ncbi:MAG: hypothetical protein FGM35_00410 [Rhodocyclaceae bacterium]|nr:hypothetical protein [Rhodocyclaceae bacterium]
MNAMLEINAVYSIQLCSGEVRLWKYLGEGKGGRVWWNDQDSGTIFNEESILYAWQILEKQVA